MKKENESKQTKLTSEQKKITSYPTERKTYSQDWECYNKAKTQEKYLFLQLTKELLDEVYPEETRKKRVGRPTLSFKEILFCACVREYSIYSSRKTISELKIAKEMHLITHVPHFNSICNFLKQELLYKELQKLIAISSLPLSKVEEHIATDSTGFNVSPYEQWMKQKWGSKKGKSRGWIKAHVSCGAKTQIICAAEITNHRAADSPLFGFLFMHYSKYFEIRSISADAAYSSKYNLTIALERGIKPFILFRSTACAEGFRMPSAWVQMYSFFKHHEEKFMKEYHQRSKIETCFSMVKKRLGSKVKSKTFIAQKNELLCRFLVHNITVLIQEMHELKINVDFEQANKVVAQKCG